VLRNSPHLEIAQGPEVWPGIFFPDCCRAKHSPCIAERQMPDEGKGAPHGRPVAVRLKWAVPVGPTPWGPRDFSRLQQSEPNWPPEITELPGPAGPDPTQTGIRRVGICKTFTCALAPTIQALSFFPFSLTHRHRIAPARPVRSPRIADHTEPPFGSSVMKRPKINWRASPPPQPSPLRAKRSQTGPRSLLKSAFSQIFVDGWIGP